MYGVADLAATFYFQHSAVTVSGLRPTLPEIQRRLAAREALLLTYWYGESQGLGHALPSV